MEPNVFISILNWNNSADTLSCVHSLLQQAYQRYQVVVIDNHSADDSVAQLKTALPAHVEVVALPANVGYAGAHWLTAKMALDEKADLFWILNNDVVVEPNSLSALVDAYHRHGAALYGSVTLRSKDPAIINFGGGWELHSEAIDVKQPYNPYDGWQYDTYITQLPERKVSDVNGSSLLIPVSVIEQHGFIDDSFFLYAEETDYCFTLFKKGVPSIIVPTSVVVHQEGNSFRKSDRLQLIRIYYRTRNNFLLFKNHPDIFAHKVKKIYSPRNIFNLFRLFIYHASQAALHKKDMAAQIQYYEQLGKLHALLGRRGKVFKPELFLQ